MKLNSQRILITGGAGFIGSHLAITLAKNNRVTILDNFDSAVLTKQALEKNKHISVIKGDIRNPKDTIKALKNIDIVFHLAVACVRLSLSDPTHVHDVNATGTLTLLLAAKKARVKKFVYISSSEVYGTSVTSKMAETHPINPTTVYGMSKYVGEQYTRYFNDHEGLPTQIVRPFNTYGPRSHFDGVYGEVIPRFAIRALNGKQPIIFGTGKQKRDFTYITDTVAGIILAAQSKHLSGHVVNIARGHDVSILALSRAITKAVGLKYQPIFRSARPNDVLRHAASIAKAKKLLGFSPTISIDEGISTYIQWLRSTYPDPKKLLSFVPEVNW